MTKKGIIITSAASLILIGTGVFLYVRKKKKQKEEESTYSDGGSTTTAAASDPRVYKALSNTQTLALQKLINKFYSTGALSGWSDIWNSVKNVVSTTAKSVVSTVTNGSIGLAEFKAAVASIMPLKEDGIYGNNTLAAVKALQTYLNANGANLTVDGKYGKNTDSATGWGVMSLAGFDGLAGKRKGKGKGKRKRKKLTPEQKAARKLKLAARKRKRKGLHKQVAKAMLTPAEEVVTEPTAEATSEVIVTETPAEEMQEVVSGIL